MIFVSPLCSLVSILLYVCCVLFPCSLLDQHTHTSRLRVHVHIYVRSYTDNTQPSTYMCIKCELLDCAHVKSWYTNDFIQLNSAWVYQVPWKWQMVKFVCRNNERKNTHSHTEPCVHTRTYSHRCETSQPASQPANNSAIQNEPLSHGQTFYLCACTCACGWNPKINRISNRWHGWNGIEGDTFECVHI